MLTVSKLARTHGLSRSTVLYYESIGLLKPTLRTESGYRVYSREDANRLNQICVYRSAGLGLEDIRELLDRPENDAAGVLQRRMFEIEGEIGKLREHQLAILRLLKADQSLWSNEAMTKDKWVSIMRAAGFNDDDMHRWHVQFESSAPDEHQRFLEYLNISTGEIQRIREWSRTGK